jgi:hypothetical protein
MKIPDDEFMARFEDCSLANESFHHRDHVRMAYLYLCRYPALEAVQRFSSALAKFAAAKGKPGLYHETITWAFLFVIRERMARGCGEPWSQFAANNGDLMNWEGNILKKYYRDETLASTLAKTTFLLPDRILPEPVTRGDIMSRARLRLRSRRPEPR